MVVIVFVQLMEVIFYVKFTYKFRICLSRMLENKFSNHCQCELLPEFKDKNYNLLWMQNNYTTLKYIFEH